MARYVVFFALPEGWERFDLWEPEAEAAITGRLDEWLSEQDVATGERQALTGAAAVVVGQARDAGVLTWAFHVPATDPARPVTLTVGVGTVPAAGPGSGRLGSGAPRPSRYLSPPSRPVRLDLLFDDVVGFGREWKLALPGSDGVSMFCAQAVVVAPPQQVVVTVDVVALEPADENEVRGMAALVARSLRLTATTDETEAAGPDHGGPEASSRAGRNGPGR